MVFAGIFSRVIKFTVFFWFNRSEVVHFDNLSISNDPARGGIFHSEAFLGKVEIRFSALKWSNSGKFQFFFEFPFSLCSRT